MNNINLNNGFIPNQNRIPGVQINQGTGVTFEGEETQIVSKLFEVMEGDTATSANTAVTKALTAAGLSLSERNIDAVNSLLQNGMSIDKGSIHKFLSTTAPFRNISFGTLAEMTKAGVTLNTINTAQFEAYRENESVLSGHIEQVLEALHELSGEGEQDAAIHTEGEGLQKIEGQEAEGLQKTVIQETEGSQTTAPKSVENSQNTENRVGEEAPKMETQVGVSSQNTENRVGEETQKIETQAGVSSQNTENRVGEETQKIETQVGGSSQNTENRVGEEVHKIETQAGGSSQNTENRLGEDGQKLESRESGNQQDTHVAGDSSVALTREGVPSSEPLDRETLQGRAATIFSTLKEKMSLKASDLKKESISEYYKSLEAVLKEAEGLAKSLGEGGEKLTQAVKDMRDNLTFLQNLNDAFVFVQVPISLRENKGESELYVYSKKKKLQPGDSVSVLLHLNMDHLGELNVHMSLAGKTINAVFRTDDKVSAGLIRETNAELSEKLLEKGYSATISVSEEKADRTSFEQLVASEETGDFRRYSFDIRA